MHTHSCVCPRTHTYKHICNSHEIDFIKSVQELKIQWNDVCCSIVFCENISECKYFIKTALVITPMLLFQCAVKTTEGITHGTCSNTYISEILLSLIFSNHAFCFRIFEHKIASVGFVCFLFYFWYFCVINFCFHLFLEGVENMKWFGYGSG